MGVTSERTITFKEAVAQCKKDGVEPISKRRFLNLMARCNFKIADEDFDPFEILVALTYSIPRIKD